MIKLGIIFAAMLGLALGLVLFPLFVKYKGGKVRGKNILVLLGILIAGASAGIYYVTGSPELVQTRAFLENSAAPPALPPAIGNMVARLRAGVEENPGDAEAWTDLAQALLGLERYSEAADTYRRAILLSPDEAGLHSALGEALTIEGGGFISPEAVKAFGAALELNAEEVVSKYYLGEYALQEGNGQVALDRWLALYEELPGDTPWLPLLDQRIREVAASLGLELPAILAEKPPERPPTPTAEEIQQMDPEDQQAMIEGMVASLTTRLEANPADLEGWAMLGRSLLVLGRDREAITAFGVIAGVRRDDPAAQEQYVQAIMTYLEATGQHVSDEALGALRRLLELDPGNPTALYFLGLAAAERSDPASARLYWQRLLTMIPPDSNGAEIVREKLERLG